MSFEALTISLGAVTAAVWGGVVIPRLRVFRLGLVYLLAVACFGPLAFRIAGPLSLDRAVFALLVVMYAWRRTTGRIEPFRFGWLDYLTVGLLGWLVLSMSSVGFGPLGNYESPFARLVHGYLIPLGLYWIVRNTFDPEEDAEPLMRLMLVFGVYLAFTGIMEYLRVWPVVFPAYIRDPSVGIHFGRARGPFVGAHSMGMCLTFTLLAAHGLWHRLGPTGRLLTGVAMVAMVGAIAVTGTRSVWLGAAAAASVVAWFGYRARQRLALMAGLALAALMVAVVAGDRVVSPIRKGGTVEATESVHAREALANISWRMFRHRPLLGHGFGHYLHSSLAYFDISNAPVPLSLARRMTQHSTFLSLLTETGLLGLALFLTLVATWGFYGIQILRCPGASALERGLACLWLGGLATFIVQMSVVEMAYGRFDNSLIGLVAGCVAATRRHLNPGAPSGAGMNQGEFCGHGSHGLAHHTA